jgi:hypothetical protein
MTEEIKCSSCDKRMYGYTDDIHDIWICYRCGHYKGQSNADMLFFDLVNSDPLILIELVDKKFLRPMK